MNQADDFDNPSGDDLGSIWLNDLFELARAPGTAEEMSSEPAVVAAMLRTIAQPPAMVDLDAKRRHAISKTAARTAIVAAALLIGASTAAATGNLPDAAQSALSRAGAHIGVDIPDPYEHRDEHFDTAASTTTPSTTTPSTTTSTSVAVAVDPSITVPVSPVQTTIAVPSISPTSDPAQPAPNDSPDDLQPIATGPAGAGPDLSGPAQQGLCRAWAAQGDDSPANQNSTAMRNLQTAAATAGQSVEEFCADVLAPESTQVVTTTADASPTTAAAGQGNRGSGNGQGNSNNQGDLNGKKISEKETKDQPPKGDE